MKERPILFNTDMVKAIIDGRKTQTRRPVKKEFVDLIEYVAASNDDSTEFDFLGLSYGECQLDNGKTEAPQWLVFCSEYPEEGVIPIGQGFGSVGDRLWVRETFCPVDVTEFGGSKWVDYRATPYDSDLHPAGWHNAPDDPEAMKWKPSIHMPHWACRLVLEITDIRLERVQDITEEDAAAEGTITEEMAAKDGLAWRFSDRKQFQDMWEKVYPNSWENNEWVWVIEFKIAELNGKK